MKTHNGHRNWNYWNVSLWLFNDEGLYSLIRERVRICRTKDRAAHSIVNTLQSLGAMATPDGAPYTYSSVRAALRGI